MHLLKNGGIDIDFAVSLDTIKYQRNEQAWGGDNIPDPF